MKYLSYFILFFILHSLKVDAVTFQKVTTVQEIEAHLQKSCDSKTLVIFDVDYVLIAPKDKIFRFCGEQDGLRKQLFNDLQASTAEKSKILNGKKIPLYDHLMSIIINTSEHESVDPLMASLIAKLQKQNVKIIALTQNRSGPLAQIPSQSDKKIKDLKKIGIDFDNSYFSPHFIVINSVSSKMGSILFMIGG